MLTYKIPALAKQSGRHHAVHKRGGAIIGYVNCNDRVALRVNEGLWKAEVERQKLETMKKGEL